MADKVCVNCGAEVPAAAVFCTQCGSRDLTEAATPPPPEEPTAETTAPVPPTVPVEPTYQVPTSAWGPSAQDAPTMADQTAVVDPTSNWSSPPAPPPAAQTVPGPAVQGQVPIATTMPVGAPAATVHVPPEQTQDPRTTPSTGGGKFGALLVLVGGAAAIVGAFLEWMKISPDWSDALTLSGWTLSDDAKIVAAAGAVAVVAAIVAFGGSLRSPMRVLSAIAGIVLVALGAYDTYDILQELPKELEAAGIAGVEIAAPGIGLILVIAGGVLVVLGALAMTGPRQATSTVDPGVRQAPGAAPGDFAGAMSTPDPATGAYGSPPGGYGPPPTGYQPPPGGYVPPPPAGHQPPPGGYVPPPPAGHQPPQGGYGSPLGGSSAPPAPPFP